MVRDGRQVAFLPEADRATRGLSLPLKEIQYMSITSPRSWGGNPPRMKRSSGERSWKYVAGNREHHRERAWLAEGLARNLQRY
ncbi:MAG TPA: hypothetical protein VJM51_05490 [Dehalococcoidia bacterium]|nr:hypothetical protein [Dehalococcoidia bacterium]